MSKLEINLIQDEDTTTLGTNAHLNIDGADVSISGLYPIRRGESNEEAANRAFQKAKEKEPLIRLGIFSFF